MPQSALLSLFLLFPALDHLGLLQFVVFSLWLILKCGNTSPSLAKVFRLRILLLALSFVLSVIDRPQLALFMLSPRPLLCAFLEFLVFLCPSLFLLLFLLGTALARQILSLLMFLSPMFPPLDPSPLLRLYPLPMPLLRDSPLFLDALFSSPLSVIGIRSHLVMNSLCAVCIWL
jgi:hypothetical protein